MDEDAINRVVKRYYGRTINEMDAMIGYLSNRYYGQKHYCKELEKEINSLNTRIAALNQYKLMCTTHFGTKINPIQQTQRLKQLEYENSQLKERINMCKNINKKNKELNKRIEKAIEYIKNETEYHDKDPIEGSWLYTIYEISKILKGDKE